jgi:flagellum-specific ATP synthase
MFGSAIRDIKLYDPRQYIGRAMRVEGLRIEAAGPPQALVLGGAARLESPDGPRAEVVGFEGDRAVLLACDPVEGLFPGAKVYLDPKPASVRPHDSWLGRVIDAFGDPVDGLGPLLEGARRRPLRASPPLPQARARVSDPLELGVRALDMFAPCGQGQRLGLFAGSGVGKSTLMSMLARNADADVVVIGLIGERGREVREFVEDTLGPDGLRRAVVVSATSDEPAPKRRRAAWMTLTIAEHFRDEGKRVLCLFDSVTRFAMAQREIGLAAGEPPTSRGYTPSVFSELPRLLERAGPGTVRSGAGTGTITGLFTVLVDGDDHNEPIADAVRGILDGHVVLSRHIAERGRYPAIDILKSLSRLTPIIQPKDAQDLAARARRSMAAYADMEELIRLGAYTKGSDAETDDAIGRHGALEAFLTQDVDECDTAAIAAAKLADILSQPV